MNQLKTAILFFCFYIISTSAICQTQPAPTKEQTRLQSFIAKKGAMIIKDFSNIGTYNGKYGTTLQFETVVVYSPGGESSKIKGLKIEVGKSEETETSLLDIDEAESLSKALTYLIDVSIKWMSEKKEYTETFFTSKDDFKLGFYQKDNEQTGFASAGSFRGKNCFFNTLADLGEIKKLVDQGITVLKSK